MKKLLTLLILAPMVAGAQIKIDTTLYGRNGIITLYTAYTEVRDTSTAHLLVVDTCGRSVYAQYVRGYIVTVSRVYDRLVSWQWQDRYTYFLNSRKRIFGKCVLVWDAKQ